jgi:hypothetical protein
LLVRVRSRSRPGVSRTKQQNNRVPEIVSAIMLAISIFN